MILTDPDVGHSCRLSGRIACDELPVAALEEVQIKRLGIPSGKRHDAVETLDRAPGIRPGVESQRHGFVSEVDRDVLEPSLAESTETCSSSK